MQLNETCPFDIAPERVLAFAHQVKGAEGNRRRLSLEGGHGYGVLVLDDDDALEVRVSGGRSLPSEFKLDAIQRRQLIEAGLTQLRASDDFRARVKNYDLDDVNRWASTIASLLKSCFDAQENDGVTVKGSVEELPVLEDVNLVSAMKRLAKVRDWSARKSLYFLLIRSRLFLLLDDPWKPGDSQAAQIRGIDTLGGGQVAAIFTTREALDVFDPRPVGVHTATGRELFPLLANPKLTSVKINPRGTVGGELYRNEILNIVEGIKRL